MRFSRATAMATITLLAAAPLSAQIPDNSSISGRTVIAAPGLMVANPYAFVSSDSAISVAIGTALRNQMDDIVGRDFSVISRETMNKALISFGYSPDAVLNPVVQRQFASTLGARVYLNSNLARTDGTVRITSRLVGINDEAGRTVVVTGPTSNLEALGKRAAEKFEPTVEALEDARECLRLSAAEPDKAAEAARSAIETDPLNGLAWYCLTEMAIRDSAPGDSIIALLEHTIEGDSLSLNAWTLLAAQNEAAGDTAAVIAAFQEMIQIAPTNEELRKRAFRYFIQAGRTEAARAAVEEAIRNDPYNPDNFDLLSNVCIFESNYTCAVDALEQAYAIDSAKADSTFFMKITVTAAQQPDTVRLLKWAQLGVQKFPTNLNLNRQLLTAYSLSGQVDSVLAVTQRVLALDTTTVAPALAAAQGLADAKRVNEALPLFEIIEKRGTPQDKENAAIILVNSALPLLQEPQDLEAAAELSRMALRLADSTGRVVPNANYVLGLATVIMVSKMDPETERTESCEMARKEQALVNESFAALTKGQSVKPELVGRYLEYLESLKARTASMISAYCK